MPAVPPALDAFIDAHDWEESKRIIISHSELMEDDADHLLDQMVEFYSVPGLVSKKGRTLERVQEHRELLRRCRHLGIETAFAGLRGRKRQNIAILLQNFFYADTLEEMKALAKRYPELLQASTEEIDSAVGMSLTAAGHLDYVSRRALLRRCAQNGVDQAFAERRDESELFDTITRWLNTNELSRSRDFLKLHPELLTDVAARVLSTYIDSLTDPDHIAVARNLATLLDECRNSNIDAAYGTFRRRLLEEAMEGRGPLGSANESELWRLQLEFAATLLESGSQTDLEAAIQILERGSADQSRPPQDIAMNNVLLARAYRTVGGSAMIATATDLLLTARSLVDRDVLPELWGDIHYMLGSFYTSLPTERDSDKQEENQYTAIQCFKEALRVAEQTGNKVFGTEICACLGLAFTRMPRGSEDEASYHLAQAVNWYKRALDTKAQISDGRRAQLFMGLADALYLWCRSANPNCLSDFVNAGETAISLVQGAEDEARVRLHFGSLLAGLAETGNEKAHIAAKEHLLQANELFSLSGTNASKSLVTLLLADLEFHEHSWATARVLYLASRKLQTESKPSDSEEALLPLLHRLSFCFCQTGDPWEAVKTLEAAGGDSIEQSLLHRLAMLDMPDSGQAEFRAVLRRLRAAQQEVRNLRPAGGARIQSTIHEGWMAPVTIYEHGDPVGSKAGQVAQQYSAAMRTLDDSERSYLSHVETFRKNFPRVTAGDPDQQQLKELTADATRAFLIPILSDEGAAVVAIYGHAIDCIPLPEMDTHALTALLGWGPVPVLGDQPLPHSRTKRSGYLGAYFDRFSRADHWLATLDQTLGKLGDTFWSPIVAALPRTLTRLTIITRGDLSLLPLHGAWSRTSDGDTRTYVIEQYEINFAPSLTAAIVCEQLASRLTGQDVYAVINPNNDPALRWSALEREAIVQAHPAATVVAGAKATRKAVLEHAANAQYTHFACHGRFNWMNPDQSGLRMGDGWLTISDISSGLWDAGEIRLATLSACETGMSDIAAGDASEHRGLPGALLAAGIPGVVGSLWSVDDMSTALLMQRFYSNHLLGRMRVSQALREAQIWMLRSDPVVLNEAGSTLLRRGTGLFGDKYLRDLGRVGGRRKESEYVRFHHPFHWAGFMCFGC